MIRRLQSQLDRIGHLSGVGTVDLGHPLGNWADRLRLRKSQELLGRRTDYFRLVGLGSIVSEILEHVTFLIGNFGDVALICCVDLLSWLVRGEANCLEPSVGVLASLHVATDDVLAGGVLDVQGSGSVDDANALFGDHLDQTDAQLVRDSGVATTLEAVLAAACRFVLLLTHQLCRLR